MGADEGMGRRVVKSGAEQDVHSRWWRQHLIYLSKAGTTAKVKRMTRRRERHLAAQEAADDEALDELYFDTSRTKDGDHDGE